MAKRIPEKPRFLQPTAGTPVQARQPTMQEIVKLTQDLIRFRSMHSSPRQIQECAAFIEAYLGSNDIAYRRIDHNGTPSIVALPNEKFVPVLLMSHIDVVNAPDALFEPSISAGKLYGRGSLDDKYAVALSLVLMKEYLDWLRSRGRAAHGASDARFASDYGICRVPKVKTASTLLTNTSTSTACSSSTVCWRHSCRRWKKSITAEPLGHYQHVQLTTTSQHGGKRCAEFSLV
jgi:hypothetical protein